MKKTYQYFVLVLLILSCSAKKNTITYKNDGSKKIADTLSKDGIDIVNDFLEVELKKDRYNIYNSLEKVLVEEARNSIENIIAYEYAYKNWHIHNRATANDNEKLGWILDTSEINKLKNRYANNNGYHWKDSDIKNYKVIIIKNEVLLNNISSGEYINLPERLILQITKPLIINKTNALISFSINNSLFGSTINRFTVLMKKKNGKWTIGPSYWDGSVD